MFSSDRDMTIRQSGGSTRQSIVPELWSSRNDDVLCREPSSYGQTERIVAPRLEFLRVDEDSDRVIDFRTLWCGDFVRIALFSGGAY